jgi:hypothetical protein
VKRLLLALVSVSLLGSTASAYQVRKSSTGAPLRWPEGEIGVRLALEDPPSGVSASAATEAGARAFDAYMDVIAPMSPSVTVAMRAGTTKAPVTAADGTTTVTWVNEGWDDDYDPNALAITITTYDTTSGSIQDADIVVNARFPWTAVDDCDTAYDLQSVLTHEVGHLFGLGHDAEDPDATMYPSAGVCETKKRDLAASDLAGLTFLYVEVAPPQPLACSVLPGGRPLLDAVWWVLGFLGVAWRRRAATALLFLVGLVAPARATTVKRLGLEAAGKGARVVARGTVRALTARRVNGKLYTDAELVVAECLKGACGAALTIRQLGGEVDGEGVSVLGNAELPVGGEVVVLLRARRDGTYAPMGMAQGVFRVERDARGRAQALVRDLSGLELVGEDGPRKPAVERVRPEDLSRALAP